MQMHDPLFDATRLPPYFSETAACFERAAGLAGRRIFRYRIGSLPFCLEFAGPALERHILPAFGHLAATGYRADFRVLLWDAKSTDVPMPPPPWTWGAFIRNEVYVGDRFKVVYNGDSGSLIMYDADARQAIFWIREAENVPYYETGAPLLPAMQWWLESLNHQLVHAGAVATADGGILLAGRGGSGKSTTALACLMDGFEFASDDYCALATSNPIRVHSIYCSAKLSADSRDRLPGLAGAIHHPGAPAEKSLYMMNSLFPGQIAASFDLRAVLLPRVSGTRETTVKPVSPALALRALAPSTMFQLAGAGSRVFHTLASIIRRVPCFEISVGHELAWIPAAIRTLLRDESLKGTSCGE
jgi:hypothetical protein